MPANRGDERLVPPMRNSPYFSVPSGYSWVRPINMPVVGSPSSPTSGTARPEELFGTTPFWYSGRLNSAENPPPAPYKKPFGVHDLPFADSAYFCVPQPVWKSN